MRLSAFHRLLSAHPDKPFHLVLPDRSRVPVAFHVTEVAHVQKRFVDCGGKLHTAETCQLQVWLGEDTDHRLYAGKMARVLEMAGEVLPEGRDLDVEIEYEAATISQYPIAEHTVTDGAIVLHLAHKHTDCLAKEFCCPPTPTPKRVPLSMQSPGVESAAAGCCGDGTSSCGC